MAEQLVKALRQMPVDELRAQMPELEQLLTTVKHQNIMTPASASLAGGACAGVQSAVGGSTNPAQNPNLMHQLRAAGSAPAAGGVDYSFNPGASSPNLTCSVPPPPPVSSGAMGGSNVRTAEESAEEARFGQSTPLLQESSQRGAPARRGKGAGGMNKVPVVEGAELEAYAARGPLTITVGRNGEMSSTMRGRGNWRRGMSVSTVGRVKIGKGGFARGAVPAAGAGNEIGVIGGVEGPAEGDAPVRKRAKRGEGPRANRVRRDPEVEGFKCCYCHNDTRFSTREELAEHKEKMHAGQKQTKQTMPCPVCGLPCKDKHLLAIHMRIHTGERPYQCTKCPAKFRCTSGLNAHLRKHAGLERTFVCFCGEQFSSRASVARHQETVHKHKTATPQTCETCGASFPGPITLQAHRRKAHGELQDGQPPRKKSRCYQCDKCDKTFHRELTLIKHMNVEHAGMQPYTCEECGESFPTAFKYKTHMEQHNPEQLLTRKICCPVCPSRFQNQRQLVGHMLCKHPDQSQAETLSLKCKVCGKQMKNYNQLQQHELEHREDWKGFECKEPGCGQFFKTRYLLTKHQVVHKGSNLTCRQCDRTFANEASFKSHLKLHEAKKEKGEEIKSRGGRQRLSGDEAGDKSPRKRHRATGRPKGRPRKHPRLEVQDGEAAEGAGSGDGGEHLEGGIDPLNALVNGALKSKKARGRPPKTGVAIADAEDLESRSGKRRKTGEPGEETVGEHACSKCGSMFGSVYDMYEHMRDCRGASLAAAGMLLGSGGIKKSNDPTMGVGSAAVGGALTVGSAKTLSGVVVGTPGSMASSAAGRAVGSVVVPGAQSAEPHLQHRVAELEAELAEMKALAAAAATSPFVAGWRDPAFLASSRPPPPPPSDPASDAIASKSLGDHAIHSLHHAPPPPPLDKSSGDRDKEGQEKDMDKEDDDDVQKDADYAKAKEREDGRD